MEVMSCAACEGEQTQEKPSIWDAGTARIVWHCATLLFSMATIAALAPFTLSPRGAESVYWLVMGLAESVPDDAAIANVGQALVSGEGLWFVPMLLWALVALYITVDAMMVFSAWVGVDTGELAKRIMSSRPALRWIAAVAMVVLLTAGASERLLREGYVRRPDLWLQEGGSAFPGLMLLLAGALLIPVTVAVTARLGSRLSSAAARLEHRSAFMCKAARCCRAVCNGVVSWILLTVTLTIGLVALPVLLVAAAGVITFVIGVWITIKMLPFALGLTFLHILCDRDI